MSQYLRKNSSKNIFILLQTACSKYVNYLIGIQVPIRSYEITKAYFFSNKKDPDLQNRFLKDLLLLLVLH